MEVQTLHSSTYSHVQFNLQSSIRTRSERQYLEVPKSVDGKQNFSRKSTKDISSEDTETHLEETGLEASYQSGISMVSALLITVQG